jgi:hypothetical protein
MNSIKELYSDSNGLFGISYEGKVFQYVEGSNGPVWVEVRFEKREEK